MAVSLKRESLFFKDLHRLTYIYSNFSNFFLIVLLLQKGFFNRIYFSKIHNIAIIYREVLVRVTTTVFRFEEQYFEPNDWVR